MSSAPTILIVDDEPLNVKLVKAHLVRAGHSTLEATSGEDALFLARQGPDLILLDVMMPGMDGLEVCRRLKADSATRGIPIIFLSAHQDVATRTLGLDLGGVDFVSKPFDPRELLARTKTHLALRAQELELRAYATRLEQMVAERTQQLIHADRLVTLGTLSAAIAHEISNPNACILGNAEMIKDVMGSIRGMLEGKAVEGDAFGWAGKFQKVDEMLDTVTDSGTRIAKISETLKGYARAVASEKKRWPLLEIVQDAVRIMQYRLRGGFRLVVDVPPGLEIHCDGQRISQAVVNLLANAADAMEGRPGEISIHGRTKGDAIIVTVRDQGVGVSDEAAQRIFDPFYTTKGETGGTGLGLFIVRHIVEEEHGGRVCLQSCARQGAAFEISLPAARQGSPTSHEV